LYIPGFETTLADIVNYTLPDIRWSGFESIKVLFFLCITGVLLLATFMQKISAPIRISSTFMVSVLVFFIWAFSSATLNWNSNSYFLFGNPEKTHGLFFYLFLFILFWVIRELNNIEKKQLVFISCIGFFVVTLYAIFQRFGFDPLMQSYSSRLDPSRIFSTL
jgi:hypothetical protein